MKNKTAEKRNILGGAFSCRLNSPSFQKLSSVQFFTQHNPLKNKSIKAFSIAEAMIALLIGSLILGYSAPLITNQIKHNNMSDVQAQVLNRKIEELRTTQSSIPSGAVMFFNRASCPTGWSPISDNWVGRFPRFAGSYTVYEYNKTSKTIDFNSGTSKTLAIGKTEEDAIRNFTGSFSGSGSSASLATGVFSVTGKKVDVTNGGEEDNIYYFDPSSVVPTDIENHPKSIALLGCIKD